MTFWHGFLSLTLIHLLAAASPGPDFALVTRESVVNGRRAGLLTSVGISLGLAVHVSYSAAGVATLVTHSPALLTAVEILGACFLIYIGASSLRTRRSPSPLEGTAATDMRASKLLSKGFLCNLLNPKAPLYFLALFTAVIPASTPTATLLIYCAWLVCLQCLWFANMSLLFSYARVRLTLNDSRVWIERFFGLGMLALAGRMIWSLVDRWAS
jgi:threonine efflux protein